MQASLDLEFDLAPVTSMTREAVTAQIVAFPSATRPGQVEYLPDLALLGVVLGDDVARTVLARFHSISRALGADERELARVAGAGAARTVKAMHEAFTRTAKAETYKRDVISSWSALVAYVRRAMAHEDREQFRVLFLDKKNQLLADEVMGHGTIDHAPVYPREVVRRCLELSASAVILVHNHPSGDPTPSSADVDVTRQVIDACRPLRIGVHDHLVVGAHGVASFKALGLM